MARPVGRTRRRWYRRDRKWKDPGLRSESLSLEFSQLSAEADNAFHRQIPALEHLAKLPESSSSKKATPSVLVVSPTRELAIQTWETLAAIAKPLKAKCVCIYGGASKEEQEALLSQQGVRVVVATPGRLIDMLNDQSLSLSK